MCCHEANSDCQTADDSTPTTRPQLRSDTGDDVFDMLTANPLED